MQIFCFVYKIKPISFFSTLFPMSVARLHQEVHIYQKLHVCHEELHPLTMTKLKLRHKQRAKTHLIRLVRLIITRYSTTVTQGFVGFTYTSCGIIVCKEMHRNTSLLVILIFAHRDGDVANLPT